VRKSATIYGAVVGTGAAFLCAEVAAIATAGSQDQFAFLFWTLPLCVAVAAQFALLASGTFRETRLSLLACLSGLVGFIEGVAYTFVVAMFLGPWIGAFGMPVLYCWAGAGAAASLAAVLAVRKGTVSAIAGTALIGILIGSSIILGPRIINAIQEGRQVEIFVFRYQDVDQQVLVDQGRAELSQTELHELKRLVPAGSLTFTSGHRSGEGKEIRVVLVLRKPVVTVKRFPLPAEGTLFIVQQENGWTESPQSGERLDRSIVLEDRQASWEGRDWTATGFLVENANGSMQGGDVIEWDRD
jgi:hypothetical protein